VETLSSDGSPHERLIQQLATDLTPVRRLRSPSIRALGWLAVVAITALVLAPAADLPAIGRRLAAAPDMWLAVVGSIATAVLAAFAAFRLCLPDAPRAWAALPLPSALLWIAASGFGCLRTWLVPETHVADLSEAGDCLLFIVGLSVPLSGLLIVMLRRACPLQPGLTALIAGLAAAAAAATLLNFFHPFDAAATDLTVHALVVALVIMANWAFSGRLLTQNFLHDRVTGVTDRSN
jgi:hypothetical protein